MNLAKFRTNHLFRYNPQNVDFDWASYIFNAIIDDFEKNTSSKFESPFVFVFEKGGNPLCSQNDRGIYCIGLSLSNNKLLNLTTQFAHEYCHRIIGGKMTRDYSGLKWFEESICEASSLYFMNHFCNFHTHKLLSSPTPLIPTFRTLYDYWTHQGSQVVLRLPINLLSPIDPQENRILYCSVGGMIAPFFAENPNLWKILLHIGDSCRWDSLTSLFEHLERYADSSYITSLVELKKLFLS